MNKKEIENKISKLISDFEKETDLEVSYVDISKENSVGFIGNKETITASIKIKN